MPAPDNNPSVIVIGGPTASGKSALALALAEALGGVVINADSMQVYRELSILTARPGAEALARAPHRLYGVLPAERRCSAALWRDMAVREIEAARTQGRRAIVAGGTGLYLRALTEGLAPIPAVPDEVRAAAIADHARLGGAAFRARLAEHDPDAAARLADGDRQRLIRAWEVLQATGRPLGHWQAMPADALSFTFDLIALQPSRKPLYEACDRRFLEMIGEGAVEEVRQLSALTLDPTLPAMKALGVPELLAHLRGEISLDRAVSQAQQATRNYAKRQLTWFRHQFGNAASGQATHPAVRVFEQLSERKIEEIIYFLRK